MAWPEKQFHPFAILLWGKPCQLGRYTEVYRPEFPIGKDWQGALAVVIRWQWLQQPASLSNQIYNSNVQKVFTSAVAAVGVAFPTLDYPQTHMLHACRRRTAVHY